MPGKSADLAMLNRPLSYQGGHPLYRQPGVSPSTLGKSLLPPGTISITLVLFVFGIFGPNTLAIWLAACVMLAGIMLLWRPGESSVMIFVFAFQWIQVSTKLFLANWQGVSVEDLAEFQIGEIETAAMLSLTGLFFLALGMRLGAGPWRPQTAFTARETVFSYSLTGFFKLYVIAAVVATLLQTAGGYVPGLSQPFLALGQLKWAFYWMLAYATFVRGANFRFWLAAFAFELLMSAGSYFSDFKTPLFVTLVAAVAARVQLSARQLFGAVALAILTLSLGIVWSAIKTDYRKFVSAGEGQVVRVEFSDRMAKLGELVYELDNEDIGDATEAFLARLSYVDFFGVVLVNVPSARAHEAGALWQDAILRPFMPRLFFPNKARIDDSERTNYYTGLGVYGTDRGTSISIGYMAESYIDFGSVGMMLPIFVLGLGLGFFYRCMLRIDPRRALLGMALATATILEVTFFEMTNAKMVGALVVTIMASWLVLRIIAPRYLPNLQARTG